MSGLSAANDRSIPPLLPHRAPPAAFALPNPFHGAPAGAATEPLFGGTRLLSEAFVAARAVATVIEKKS
jgi:hypothetical protein